MMPVHVQRTGDAAMGEAWRRCVAALPPHHSLQLVTNGRGSCHARAIAPFVVDPDDTAEAWGDTETEALVALAERLEAGQ